MSGDLNIKDELIKEALGEVTSLALPGVRTAFRFFVVTLPRGDPLSNALKAALDYQFAIAPAVSPVVQPKDRNPLSKLGRRREAKRKKRARKGAVKQAQRMTQEEGVDFPALIAASADRGTATADASRVESPVAGVLVPLQLLRIELAHATNSVVPSVRGWREHVAEALTSAANAGLLHGEDQVRRRWERILSHSLGISDNYVERTADWGRLVAAAFEHELRKAEEQASSLSMQLDRADAAARLQEFRDIAQLARHSLHTLTLSIGVIAVMSVLAVLIVFVDSV